MNSNDEVAVGERYDELLEFVYLSPFALLRIDETGAIEMMNAMGANILLQFSPTPQLENLFDILEAVAPEIGAMVKGFAADRGTICRGYRLEAPGEGEAEENAGPLVLALDLVKLGPRRIMAAFNDISRLEDVHRARRALLDTVSEGLVTVDARGKMFGECSKALVRLLGAPEPGQYLWDYVAGAPRFAGALALGWEQLVDDVFPLEVSIEQLPRTLEVGGVPLGVSYEPTVVQKKLVSMLIVVRDRTAELERERLDAEQRELIGAVSCLARDRDGFREFIAETSRLIRTLVDVPDTEATTMLRVLHTLKGSASLVGVTSIASTCHELETRLAGRDGGLTPDERVLLDEQWNVLRERFSLFLPEVGDDVVMSLEEHANLLRDVQGGASREDITRKLETLTLGAVEPQLARLGEQAAALARRLEKGPLAVRVDGSGLRHPLRAFTPSGLPSRMPYETPSTTASSRTRRGGRQGSRAAEGSSSSPAPKAAGSSSKFATTVAASIGFASQRRRGPWASHRTAGRISGRRCFATARRHARKSPRYLGAASGWVCSRKRATSSVGE